ncbi:MAG: tRNA pseudouridine(54/55) synthase Pus10 [Candidatus Thermoplasmatota archaeon]|nr:tRNA pseudouridine(54/55) synthase Pus10 [Candidatus Thermoplasmatota archaeon]MCL5731723.1 tRNA pseudouridine(54/55) synthase Pus10 [Candidatus Thermoplasmatota archaeon]
MRTKILEEAFRGCCPRCIGRILYGAIPVEGNVPRGKLALFVMGILGYDIREVSESECRLCKGLFMDIDRYADRIVHDLSGREISSILVGSIVSREYTEIESEIFSATGFKGERIKKEFNRELGKSVSGRMGIEAEFSNPDVIVTVDLRYDDIQYYVRPLFIYGKYRKLVRGIPQTRWIHAKSDEKSVEELIGIPAMEMAAGTNFYLHGAGREDVDVRMLGNGREFILEVSNPRIRKIDLDRLASSINSTGRVEVFDIRFSDSNEVERIKSERNDKVYTARILAESPISKERLDQAAKTLCGKIIYQRTPLRVTTRRADLIRQRLVKQLRIVSIHGNEAGIEITAEAGTYIKELVSGDSGRTVPSLSSEYGEPLRVLELDVMNIIRED